MQETGDTFAMKVIRKDVLTKKNDIEHTKTERRLLQKIKHPYIVQVRCSRSGPPGGPPASALIPIAAR